MYSKSSRSCGLHHYQCLGCAIHVGITLLEMLLAVTLTMTLMTVLTRAYLIMHKQVSQLHDLEAKQLAAQRVNTILHEEIHMAGHIGCAKLTNNFSVQPLPAHLINEDNFLVANENGLYVRYQHFPGVVLQDNMLILSRMVTDTNVKYHAGQLLIISDCTRAEIFEVATVVVSVKVQMIIAKRSLHYLFKRHAEIGEYVSHHYFINTSHHRDGSISHVFSRQDVYGNIMELVKDINHLNLKKGQGGVNYSFTTVAIEPHRQWHGYVLNEAWLKS